MGVTTNVLNNVSLKWHDAMTPSTVVRSLIATSHQRRVGSWSPGEILPSALTAERLEGFSECRSISMEEGFPLRASIHYVVHYQPSHFSCPHKTIVRGLIPEWSLCSYDHIVRGDGDLCDRENFRCIRELGRCVHVFRVCTCYLYRSSRAYGVPAGIFLQMKRDRKGLPESSEATCRRHFRFC